MYTLICHDNYAISKYVSVVDVSINAPDVKINVKSNNILCNVSLLRIN